MLLLFMLILPIVPILFPEPLLFQIIIDVFVDSFPLGGPCPVVGAVSVARAFGVVYVPLDPVIAVDIPLSIPIDVDIPIPVTVLLLL